MERIYHEGAIKINNWNENISTCTENVINLSDQLRLKIGKFLKENFSDSDTCIIDYAISIQRIKLIKE